MKAPALAPLADGDADLLADLSALESVTNGRLHAETSGRPDLDPNELVHGRPNASFVNAASIYTRPGGNRFNDERRGAWYCGFDVETALDEVAFHLSQELAAIGRYENVTDYGELVADFVGPFHDVRGPAFADAACLGPDTTVAYPAGQALAHSLRTTAASNGLIYPSARRKGGTCLVAFHPQVVQNVRQGGIWRIAWHGSSTPSITPHVARSTSDD